MKKFLIWFCVIFTVIVLFTSFVPYRNYGKYFVNGQTSSYGVDEIEVGNSKYLVVTTSEGGVAICKE